MVGMMTTGSGLDWNLGAPKGFRGWDASRTMSTLRSGVYLFSKVSQPLARLLAHSRHSRHGCRMDKREGE